MTKITTKQDKKLLFQSLCARLPYGVKVYNEPYTFNLDNFEVSSTISETIIKIIKEGWKPYLRPMSSMTEEEEKEYWNIDNRSYSCPMDCAHIPASERIDWLNAHHFDYGGLIEKGLAIEVTEKNNPYKL